ncbi:hypothetical protein VTN00DRAFT_1734 [Thermoascus crustaceus]|uniref:uncharacterized protein n=1 Tax=Thermoascus crustaceus TaxID=5088 RepID=UPI00374258FD
MRFSIGVEGDERRVGTLGGFATLKIGDIVHKGFLTTYSAVRPSPSQQTRARVHYLAAKDALDTKKRFEKRVKELDQEMDGLRSERRNREIAQMEPLRHFDEDVKCIQKMINSYRKKLGKVGDMPIEPGEVPPSSEGSLRSVDGKHILDWAFLVLSPGIPALAFAQISPGAWYLKCGRTTEVTAGVCNSVKAYCRWNVDDAGHKGFTEEFVILGKTNLGFSVPINGHGPHWQQTSFCASGDEGSLVINRRRRVCVLLHGEVVSWCGPGGWLTGGICIGMGLVSCMSKVIESIEEKTTRWDESGDQIAGPAELELPSWEPTEEAKSGSLWDLYNSVREQKERFGERAR